MRLSHQAKRYTSTAIHGIFRVCPVDKVLMVSKHRLNKMALSFDVLIPVMTGLMLHHNIQHHLWHVFQIIEQSFRSGKLVFLTRLLWACLGRLDGSSSLRNI